MKTAVHAATRVGTAVTAVVALLPYIRDFFITAYVGGALAAVWFAIRMRHASLSFKDGAQLGFLSGFYGLLVASTYLGRDLAGLSLPTLADSKRRPDGGPFHKRGA
jgi:hypothetical protein